MTFLFVRCILLLMTEKMEQCQKFADEIFDCEDDPSMKWLTYEWVCDRFADRFITKFMPSIIECYDKLEGTDDDNRFEYNDLDNYAWRVEFPNDRKEWPSEKNIEARAFVHEDQNRNILFVIKPNYMYEIDKQKFNLMVYSYRQDWNAKENETLGQLLKRGGSKYNDARDKEYVCGNNGMKRGSEGAYTRLPKIEMAMFDIETLHTALTEE